MLPQFTNPYLNLLREIATTRFKLKDQSTFFGFIWSFLNPILMLVILFAVFKFRVGQEIENYAIYLLIGVVQYTHFSNTTGGSMGVLCSMGPLTSDTIFPKEVLVIGSVVANTIELVFSLIFCLIIAFFTGLQLSWATLFLPVVILMQVLFVMWVSLLLSCIYVYVRDLRHIYQVFLRMLFFITPIFYLPSFVGDGLGKYIVQLNPLTHLMQFSRTLIIDGAPLPLDVLFLFFAAQVVMVYFCLFIFRKLEPTFAEHL